MQLLQLCSDIQISLKCISESGNHDNRNYEDDWGERYNGLVENSDYASQANQLYAKNLKGKLLIAHGMMDDNVPPYNALLVIEALEKQIKIMISLPSLTVLMVLENTPTI